MPDSEQFSIETTTPRHGKRLAPSQISLLRLFMIVGIAAVIFGTWRVQYEDDAPYLALERLGASVSFKSSGPHDLRTDWACVDFDGVRVTSEHFAVLQRCNARLSIDFTNAQLGDGVVDSLIALRQMRHVEIAGSAITADALRKIRRARPELAIGQDESPFNLAW